MKNLGFLFCLLVFMHSCKKSDDQIPIVNTPFDKMVLEGYDATSIAFDKSGNAWMGTYNWNGTYNNPELIRYNKASEEIIIYNSSNSIIEEGTFIWDIEVDNQGNIWIGSDGIIKFDGNTFSKYNSKNSPIPVDFVHSITVDPEDNIWFSSSSHLEGGLVKYDGTNWTVYTPENTVMPYNGVKSIAIDKNNNLWLALYRAVTESCLVKIANDNWKTYTSNELGFTPFLFGNIQINSKNQICGAIDYTFSDSQNIHDPQIFIFDEKNTMQLQCDTVLNITKIVVDREDNIWGMSRNAYVMYNGTGWTIDDTTFNNLTINTIELSNEGNVWIGTDNGVYINDL